ncbi:uncharacterized protein LOC132562268 [Ylistrum balloti]|uniref:uncharacterized protein LOC132562268 n=1 Tax=Ylistrum balloti TaxID=509963 RepID=UPI002905C279|nr:uncharacterized protein LOC132562268 [Ylistrum balloti]
MAELTIYSINSTKEPPSQLRVSDGGFYQYCSVPLPDQMVVFCLGKFPVGDRDVSIEATFHYKDDILTLGTLDEKHRALCWERSTSGIPDSMTSTTENGMAKLVLEIHGISKSSTSDEDTHIAPVLKAKKSEQEKSEKTPQIIDKKVDPIKPTKQKRRSSTGKGEKTPTGPSSKKQRKNTRVRGLKLKMENESSSEEKSDKENMSMEETQLSKLVSSEKKIIHSQPPNLSKVSLSFCKDVTSRVGPNPSSRWGHSLCMVHEKKMAVLVGGQGERQQLSKDSVWTLDPVTRKWRCPELKSETQKPEYRMGHTASYDPMVNCIYVYGGSKNLKWFHDVHMLDIDEWKWQQLKVSGKAPTRAYHSATLYRNELWIFGGVYPRPDPQPDGCSNDVHIFSPVMESWYTPIIKGDKPIARSGHSATLMKDQLVVFGGWDAPYVYNDLHILDLSMVEWSQPKVSGTPPNPRSWHASCALTGNRILIHGGYDGNLALDDTHVFCLDSLTWMRIRLDPKPIARAGHQAVCLPYSHDNDDQDEVLVFGGGDNDGAFYRDLISVGVAFNPELEIVNTEDDAPPVLSCIDGNVAC